jgi:carbon monoxide dehydrogenase subunit G
MVAVSRTFVVNKPVSTVLAYLADFSNAEQWDPGTQSCTQIGTGPVQVGTSWKNVSKIAGVTTEIEYTLEALDADRVLLVGRNATATSTDSITVKPHAEGSEITYDAKLEFKGLAKLGGPVVRLVFEHLANETEEGIQKAVADL